MKKIKHDEALLTAVFAVEAESYDCEAQAENVAAICTARGYDTFRDAAGNVFATKGKAKFYPTYVAHLDTVHDITGSLELCRMGEILYAMDRSTVEQIGVGGDDKCGIYAALLVADMLPACKLAFFVDEEVGCIGSRAADKAWFADCAFVAQADRRGSRDFVNNICGPLASAAFGQAMKPLLKARGFTACSGAMTDVEALRDGGCGVSVCNMSAGYHNPHSSREYVHLGELLNTASLMLDMGRDMSGKRWAFTPAPRPKATFAGFSRPAEAKGARAAEKSWREESALWAKYYGGPKNRPAGVSRLTWEAETEEANESLREEFPGWPEEGRWPL